MRAEGGNLEKEAGLPHSRVGSDSRSPVTRNSTSHVVKETQGTPKAQKSQAGLSKLNQSTLELGNGEDNRFKHLPLNEAEILKQQIDSPTFQSGLGRIYKYATTLDLTIIAISALCTIASGAAMPLMTVVFGRASEAFQQISYATIMHSEFQGIIINMELNFVYIGIGQFVTTYLSTVGFLYTGERISGKIRAEYLAACLKQNIGYFDKLGAGEITTTITADTNLIQDGISQKLGLALNALATFITAYVIGFIKSWKFTLVLSSTVVAVTLVMGGATVFIVKYTQEALGSYAQAGVISEEVISTVRTAVAFGTQQMMASKYDGLLHAAEVWGFKVKAALAVMTGLLTSAVYLSYGLSFWQGSRFLLSGDISFPSLITITMALLMGAFSLGAVAPNAQAIMAAVSAAGKVFIIIARVSPMDFSAKSGDTIENLKGAITLRNIKHIYPSRPDVVVMQDVNLVIPAGKNTALVGSSGSGKSTIIGLIERFYNPVGGQVLLDGHDIQSLNLRWLRQQVSLVGQEPYLFRTTIFANIEHGLIGTRFEHEDSIKREERITNAAKMANAHDFISNLPESYYTDVGDDGFLSGGQKQRIAIARAIVSDPKILLLDEATSALDTKSEGVVQAALEAASAGRTTITIAHRLSTIKDADNIVVMAAGRIVEQGSHDQLVQKGGTYFDLVQAQKISQENWPDHRDGLSSFPCDEKYTQSMSALFASPDDPDELELITRDFGNFGAQRRRSWFASRNSAVESKYSIWSIVKLISSFNKKEWLLMLTGLFFSLICGVGFPVQAVFFAKEIVALAAPLTSRDKIQAEVQFWSVMFVVLAAVEFAASLGQGLAFGYCSEKLIRRVRDRAFRAILRQDIAFFDQEENSAGALTSFLSTKGKEIEGLSGVVLGTILASSTTIVSSVILSLAVSWELALVCSSTIPVLLGCGFFRVWMLMKFQERAKKAYQDSAGYACEAINAIKTVASLCREDDVIRTYRASLAKQEWLSVRSILKSSLVYAAAESFFFVCAGLGFWYGGNQIADNKISMFQFFVCFSAILFGATSAGIMFSSAPDIGKAKQAGQDLKTLFDRKPSIDTWSSAGATLEAVQGDIEFRDVHFRYPTRLNQPVLRGLNLSIKRGQYIALVGASGCGKSTMISLLERFFDPISGSIYLDGQNISLLNINKYRSYIALVGQEPTLYQGTIRENILLGVDHERISDAQIEFVCREANIYDFIVSLPQGLSTIVGSKGAMLSGGQKQRIAIARALLRKPKILLLDEATSALDSKSEQIVQAALDKAAKGRTTIAVAHRLSSIQNADVIYVVDKGRVVEAGTHRELIAKRRHYAKLVQLQSVGPGVQ